MNYRYPLPEKLQQAALALEEFANGAAQCHVRLKDSTTWPEVLVAGGVAIAAMRGHAALPFSMEEVDELFQTDEDGSPRQRGDWVFFDTWASGEGLGISVRRTPEYQRSPNSEPKSSQRRYGSGRSLQATVASIAQGEIGSDEQLDQLEKGELGCSANADTPTPRRQKSVRRTLIPAQ